MYGIGISTPAAQAQGYDDNAYIVCNLPPFLLGVLNLLPKFQKGGLDRTSTLRGGLLEKKQVAFFNGERVAIFTKKLN